MTAPAPTSTSFSLTASDGTTSALFYTLMSNGSWWPNFPIAGVNPAGEPVPLNTDNQGNLLVNVAVGGGGSSGGTVTVSGGTLALSGGTLAVSNAGSSLLSVGGTVNLASGAVVSAGPLPASGVTAVAGSFASAGASAPFTPPAGRSFNIAVWATGGTAPGSSLNGTVYLARSTDGGTTYLALTANGTQLELFTTCASESWSESQVGATYELVCSAISSGTINYRMSA